MPCARAAPALGQCRRGSLAGDQHTLTARGTWVVGGWWWVVTKCSVIVGGGDWRWPLQVFKALLLVMLSRVVLGKVVGPVGGAAFPVDNELSLAYVVADPVKRISMALDRFCFTDSLAIPLAVELSVTIGVGGCVWPSSSRVMRSGTASLPL